MNKKILILTSSLILASIPTLKIVETTKKYNLKTKIKNNNNNKDLSNGLYAVKESILDIYNKNKSKFEEAKNKEEAFNIYQKEIEKEKLQYAYENKFESKWHWFGYWRWYATWKGFCDVLGFVASSVIMDGLDLYYNNYVKEIISYLVNYLGSSSAIPVIGWIVSVSAVVLVVSIVGAVVGHRLWNQPRGIVMSFTLVVYSGSWLQ